MSSEAGFSVYNKMNVFGTTTSAPAAKLMSVSTVRMPPTFGGKGSKGNGTQPFYPING
jgi:hypothetical protein